jgi:hypothetical protein
MTENPIERGQIVEYELPQTMAQEIRDIYPKIGRHSDLPDNRLFIVINANFDETLIRIPAKRFREMLRRLEQ